MSLPNLLSEQGPLINRKNGRDLKFKSGFDRFLASGVTLCKTIDSFENLYRDLWLIIATLTGFSDGFS